MKRLYKISCAGCSEVFRAWSVARLAEKVRDHRCWEAS